MGSSKPPRETFRFAHPASCFGIGLHLTLLLETPQLSWWWDVDLIPTWTYCIQGWHLECWQIWVTRRMYMIGKPNRGRLFLMMQCTCTFATMPMDPSGCLEWSLLHDDHYCTIYQVYNSNGQSSHLPPCWPPSEMYCFLHYWTRWWLVTRTIHLIHIYARDTPTIELCRSSCIHTVPDRFDPCSS